MGDAGAVINNPSLLYKTVIEADATNSSSEVDLLTYNVPANMLGTSKSIRLILHGTYENNSGSPTVIIRFKYGSTAMYQDTTATIGASALKGGWIAIMNFHAMNDTMMQMIGGWFSYGARAAATAGYGDLAAGGGVFAPIGGTAAEDSSTALALKFSVQWSAAATSSHWRMSSATVELLN